ncbi:MAG: Ku protein [Solirubrobacteraceae bacterium]
MARSIWSGSISFGLVNVPVKLYSAVSRKTVHFHQLHDADHARIQQRRVCSADGEEVPYENIVKGYEIAPDQYVVIEPAELESLDPEKTKTIEIEQFVEAAEINPILYDQPYYLMPATGAGKAYRLMLEAMREADRVAIGRVVLRQKGHVVALRPHDDVLTMETLVYADEIVAVDSLGESGVEGVKVSKRELDVARQLVDMLSGPFDPDRFRDDYRDAVLAMIERKAAGEEISLAPAAPAPKAVPDLMAALQASIEAVGRHAEGEAGEAPAKPKRRARAAASSTARKPARKS